MPKKWAVEKTGNTIFFGGLLQKRFYLDTSIWRDYFEDRRDNIRPLGEFAFWFLKKCEKEKDFVIVSDVVRKELLGYYPEERVKQVFSSFEGRIIEIEYSKEQSQEAFGFWKNRNKRFPLFDVLHSIIARDNKAVLITRDKHFEEIGIADCSLPEKSR